MINIYSDPHIGLNLAANTTVESRKRLREFITRNTCKVIDGFSDGFNICAGDFYHTYQNPEEVLEASLWPANATDCILSGNHDVVNISGKKGTLDIVGTVWDGKVIPCKFGEVNYSVKVESLPADRFVYMVPHHSTQELFEEALYTAAKDAGNQTAPSILVTHCNYDCEFIKDKVTLNMTERQARTLLKSFSHIVLGHEHNFKTALDDKLVVVGSPHPTGFGDISDKFTVHFDQGEPSVNEVWNKNKHYVECDFRDVTSQLKEETLFIRLTGEIPPSELHVLSSIIKATWNDAKPFAIKSDVKILTGDITQSNCKDIPNDDISRIIEAELKKSPELYALWKEVTGD